MRWTGILSLLLNRCDRSVTAPSDKERVALQVASVTKHERKEEEEEEEQEEEEEKKEKDSATFELSAILRKFDNQSHDRVQLITFTLRTKIIQPIKSFENVFETNNSLVTKV